MITAVDTNILLDIPTPDERHYCYRHSSSYQIAPPNDF
jgi:hypothetical protein